MHARACLSTSPPFPMMAPAALCGTSTRSRGASLGARGVGTQGNLDPDLLRNGPIDAIERAAAEVLAAAQAPGGAHICNLGHGIMADTPEEHAEAFIRAVQAAGGS